MAKNSKNKVTKDVKKNNKDKRRFWKDFKAELKKVIWPTPKQLFKDTVAVLSIIVVIAVIVFVLDLGFEALNKHGINRLKGIAENSTTQNTVIENSMENNTNEIGSENQVDENNTVQQ